MNTQSESKQVRVLPKAQKAAEQDLLLYKFDKNQFNQVLIRERIFNGKKYIDIRVFGKSDKGIPFPTKKGIMLNTDKINELKKALNTVLVNI